MEKNEFNVRINNEQKNAVAKGAKDFALAVGKAAIVFLSALLGAMLGN